MKIKKKPLLKDDIQQRWMKYLAKISNEDYENVIDFSEFKTLKKYFFFCFYRRMSKAEVKEALKKRRVKKLLDLMIFL